MMMGVFARHAAHVPALSLTPCPACLRQQLHMGTDACLQQRLAAHAPALANAHVHTLSLPLCAGNYNEYFGLNTDVDAVVYLMLVNNLLHDMFPSSITIGASSAMCPDHTVLEGREGRAPCTPAACCAQHHTCRVLCAGHPLHSLLLPILSCRPPPS